MTAIIAFHKVFCTSEHIRRCRIWTTNFDHSSNGRSKGNDSGGKQGESNANNLHDLREVVVNYHRLQAELVKWLVLTRVTMVTTARKKSFRFRSILRKKMMRTSRKRRMHRRLRRVS